jgi:hypothetical protein
MPDLPNTVQWVLDLGKFFHPQGKMKLPKRIKTKNATITRKKLISPINVF